MVSSLSFYWEVLIKEMVQIYRNWAIIEIANITDCLCLVVTGKCPVFQRIHKQLGLRSLMKTSCPRAEHLPSFFVSCLLLATSPKKKNNVHCSWMWLWIFLLPSHFPLTNVICFFPLIEWINLLLVFLVQKSTDINNELSVFNLFLENIHHPFPSQPFMSFLKSSQVSFSRAHS